MASISLKQLKRIARTASRHAYSPYSEIRVGAVVEDAEGNTYSGCNVESASYGLTQCAERNALGAAIAAGVVPGTMRRLLVFSDEFKALAPCGACRQVMSELLAEDAQVICCAEGKPDRQWRMQQLFPDPFELE